MPICVKHNQQQERQDVSKRVQPSHYIKSYVLQTAEAQENYIKTTFYKDDRGS